MNNTQLKYMDDTYLLAGLAKIIEIGSDKNGIYLILDQTIHYPGGGGQPMDSTYIQKGNSISVKITGASFNGGNVKHYVPQLPDKIREGDNIALQVDRPTRLRNAAYHSAGHWIASIIKENIQLPLQPTKGYHYSNGAYVEFDGNIDTLPEDLLYQIEYAMRIDRQANLMITSSTVDSAKFLKMRASIEAPSNFTPMEDRALRLVTFDDYKSVPCGGTHLSSIRELGLVTPTKVKLKNKKIRISYEVEIPLYLVPS